MDEAETELTALQRRMLALAMAGDTRDRGLVIVPSEDAEYIRIARELVDLGLLEGGSDQSTYRHYFLTDAGAAYFWTPAEAELARAKVGDRVRFAA